MYQASKKKLLIKYIEKSKINWAHIALACLLKSDYIAKVLTFNFDNILNRACSLDNFFPPIYDLHVLSEEYFSAIPNRSIIHLHGQWSGFELANGDKDTAKQADKLKSYIKDTINTAPSIFIGYSGGADAFFKLVEENFLGQHRLFWVDYSKEPNANVKKFIDANSNHRNFIGEQDADKFLLELAIELNCFPTNMFKDPIKHMKEICELINEFPLATIDSQIDILEDTKKTLDIAHASSPAIKVIKLAEYLNGKKFDTIINQKEKLDLNIKPISKILASAYLGKALTFLTKDESQFQKNFDKAIELEPNFYQAYAEAGNKLTSHSQKQNLELAISYFEKCFALRPNLKDDSIIGNYAVVLTKLAILEKKDTTFYHSFEQYKKTLKIQPDDADHLGNYATSLYSLGKLKEDEDLFNKAFEQYEKTLKIQPDHVKHLGNYGNALSNLAKLKEDEDLFNKAFNQYEKALKIQPDDADILGNYATSLYSLGKLKEEEDLFNKAFNQYEKALKVQPDDADILGNYANALSSLAKLKEDEDLFNKAFNQYEKALKVQPDRVNNLGNYATALSSLAKLKEDEDLFNKAFELYEKFLKFKPNETYNVACYYAVKGNLDLAKNNLLHAEQHNTLPENPFKHLSEDKDLDNIRNEQWFIELLERLKTKEELEKVA
ncbi:TPR end-of-group domain-containing protein [Acinetobacter sp. WCHAc060033]|uniref:TPR end-of-group domain-containing protein n=1 Tax=Acinetobacter sp. WCHAc060033 TaxID=2518624 RepID=UPI00148EA393|nr:tetratricopeptide repeat-containing protein [Acinetobacter sp. WCHAc060033]